MAGRPNINKRDSYEKTICLFAQPPFLQADYFWKLSHLQGKRCFANPAKCQNGWRLNSFLWLVLFIRLSLGGNSCKCCAESVSPEPSKGSSLRRGSHLMKIVAFSKALLFPERD